MASRFFLSSLAALGLSPLSSTLAQELPRATPTATKTLAGSGKRFILATQKPIPRGDMETPPRKIGPRALSQDELLAVKRDGLIATGLGHKHPIILEVEERILQLKESPARAATKDEVARELNLFGQMVARLQEKKQHLLASGLGPKHAAVATLTHQIAKLNEVQRVLEK